jgi:hypothetical protein
LFFAKKTMYYGLDGAKWKKARGDELHFGNFD